VTLIRRIRATASLATLLCVSSIVIGQSLQPSTFKDPPPAAQPWVYWFWNNGNVTREGITADLEAMHRVGIGGVILMDVVERFAPPVGKAGYMTAEWQSLMQFALQEASRLGLEVNLTNGPGWCGSSGPWITPELAMQKLVDTSTDVEGPKAFSDVLPQPEVVGGKGGTDKDGISNGAVFYDAYYRDIAVLAFPLPDKGAVRRQDVVDLTAKMDAAGKLNWNVPAGKWIIKRIGHTTTGASTRPPVAGGNGLECDKLSTAAMDAQIAGMLGKISTTAGRLTGKSLTATHIDSWEVGTQDWTPKFHEEFLRRRGYDPVPYLPTLLETVRKKPEGKENEIVRTPNLVDGEEGSFRFRFDFAKTRAELLAENYVGRLAGFAHTNGMRLSIEGYLLPFGDQATYAAAADEPMAEFWTSGWGLASPEARYSPRQASSVAHTTGRQIVGAEAFTSDEGERWGLHPALIKALGDQKMSEGINRFVIHRYAHQPYTDRAPGATMGPWGLHYERTNTWWEMSTAWHTYLARCQQMLREGLFVADLCYVRTEWADQQWLDPIPAPPPGYRYDEISVQTLIERMSVKDHHLVLPDGMSYRVLVLPPADRMTVPLIKKVKELVNAGATVLTTKQRPTATPTYQGYPECDNEIDATSLAVWGNCDGKSVTRQVSGKGVFIWGESPDAVLERMGVTKDFSTTAPLNWIHRRTDDAEIYFVANPSATEVEAQCSFRVLGKQPELWDPESGQLRDLPDYARDAQTTTVPLKFGPTQSYFIVFRKPAQPAVAGMNFPALLDVQTLTGKWSIRFPIAAKAPVSIQADKLASWSDHPDAAIRYFSGTATYTTTFRVDTAALLPSKNTFALNLGDVHVMARVRINGKDCGIAWKSPYRVDVTNAISAGDNTLEVEVANLWPNRLIGDSSLPESERTTWSSWQPFKPNDPLLKSGLLGPVTLQRATSGP
jgi:hypothetical protein